MATRKSFTATAAATFGTNIGVAVISLLNVLVTARILGPGGRGELALLTTITILTASLAAFGLYEANANIGAREPGKRGALAANSLVLALVLGGAAAALVAVLVVVFPALGGGTDPLLQALALAAIPVLILQSGLGTLIQSQYGFAVTNTAWLLAPSTSLALNGALAAFGLLTVGSAVLVWIAGQVTATALLAWHAVRRLEGVPRPDVSLARQMLSFGSRTHLGRVMTMGNYRLDQWIVGEDFRGSIDDLRVLAFGAFGIVALKLLGNALIAQSKPMRANVGVAVAFVVTVGLDLLLIPSHGGIGAAIASTSAYTAGGVAILVVFCRALGRRPVELLPRGNELGPLLRQLRAVVTARPATR